MQEKKKFYQAKWFLWLSLILFPPLGIILIWAVHKDMQKNKKIILTVIFAIWFVILMAATSGNNSNTNNSANNQQETKEEKSVSEVETSNDKFTNDEIEKGIMEAVKDDIDSENESIKAVKLKDNNLCVYVDLSNADPSPLTIEDLAWSRTGSITDAILEHTEYFDYWKTVTIDFGDVGKVTFSQDDIETNEFGGRYFPEEKYELK